MMMKFTRCRRDATICLLWTAKKVSGLNTCCAKRKGVWS